MTKKALLSFDTGEIILTIILFLLGILPGIIYLLVKTPLGKEDIIGLILFILGIIPGIIYCLLMRK